MNKCFENISNSEVFEGILIVIEEIMNITKQSYYEFFEDFKRCANVLVSEATLRKLFAFILESEGSSFTNALSYLEMVLKRINTEKEEAENDYYRNEDTGPTMQFEHKFIFNEIDALLSIACILVEKPHVAFV